MKETNELTIDDVLFPERNNSPNMVRLNKRKKKSKKERKRQRIQKRDDS